MLGSSHSNRELSFNRQTKRKVAREATNPLQSCSVNYPQATLDKNSY